jgi:endonuclease/exonuclease/phosphatase family metal-dependent hydrolase
MGPVRVLTYNVRYFGHATRGIGSTRGAMTKIAKAIAALDPVPDIVCLQEVETNSLRCTWAHPEHRNGETQLEHLMRLLSHELQHMGKKDQYEAYYFPAHQYRIAANTHVYTTGLAVLAHDDFVVDHHNAGEPHDITHRHVHAVRRLKQTRICAHVRFRRKKGGEPIDVFNTHLSLPTTLSRAFWTHDFRMGWGPNQVAEARNLARFVEKERASDRFVVVGDFNALPGSPVYRHLVDEVGFVDPFARLHRMNDDELRHWPTAGFMSLRMHLDHVFSGPGLKWIDFEGSHPFGDRTAAFHGLSDHMPLIGRCRS